MAQTRKLCHTQLRLGAIFFQHRRLYKSLQETSYQVCNVGKHRKQHSGIWCLIFPEERFKMEAKGMRAKNRERISRCCSDVAAGDIIRQFIGFLRLLNIFFHMWEYLNCSGCNICIFQPTYLTDLLWKTCATIMVESPTCGTVLKQTVHATQHLVDSPAYTALRPAWNAPCTTWRPQEPRSNSC